MKSSATAVITGKNSIALNREESAIISCLLYFNCFDYPLTIEEIIKFSGVKFNNQESLQLVLDTLLEKNLIKSKEIFYFVSENENIIERRLKGNKMAQNIMPKALKYGKFISQFPFVETVCISGALSKNYFDEKGDVDFFIITKPHRLWVCRSFLVGFKKVFLLNSRKYFCVNYFVGSDNLSIPDRNIFTATEITSLILVDNSKGFTNFIAENDWIYQHLPNFSHGNDYENLKTKEGLFKRFCETILGSAFGDFVDKKLFNLTLSVWEKKFSHFNKADFDLNMRSRKNVSKHHPSGFQQKVLSQWKQNKVYYCNKHQVAFAGE